MGIIISGVRLIKPAYDFILKTAPRIDTGDLQDELEEVVYDSFTALRPLRYGYLEVCEMEGYSYSDYTAKLCMGEWLRTKTSSYYKYGSTVEGRGRFLKLIRRHGDELKPHVRRPIEEDFPEFVELTKRLKPYDELLVRAEIPETELFEYATPSFLREGGEVEITSMTVNGIGVKTSRPCELLLFMDGEDKPESRNLTYESKACLFEDIISYIVDLFREADAEVERVRNHNKPLLEQMKITAAAHRVSDGLS